MDKEPSFHFGSGLENNIKELAGFKIGDPVKAERQDDSIETCWHVEEFEQDGNTWEVKIRRDELDPKYNKNTCPSKWVPLDLLKQWQNKGEK